MNQIRYGAYLATGMYADMTDGCHDHQSISLKHGDTGRSRFAGVDLAENQFIPATFFEDDFHWLVGSGQCDVVQPANGLTLRHGPIVRSGSRRST
jgi:hypothetical protein